FHKVIPTDPLILPITTSEGTGLVHTAVSAGSEDYRLGMKLGLPMIPVIADDASYIGGFDFLTGKNAKKHPELVLDFLNRDDKNGKNWVFQIEKYMHRYPACWRCKTELVWKVADEWYIAMDRPDQKDIKGRTLRQQMQDVAKQIRWLPGFGLERELDWLTHMHDWLISKPNRYWGLALPIYECKKCGHFEVIGSKTELKQKSVSGWEEFAGHSPHKPWIDEVKIKCEKCDNLVDRLPDVGNVWLDAGIVPYSTLVDPKTGKVSYTSDKKYWQQWFPANFITESFPGQFKNWFYSLIAMSTVLERIPPFKTVLGYGTLLGEDGRPMHKSWGNSIEFNEGAGRIGADVMRWMYASHDPTQNMLFGYKKADETRRRFHLLLWNIYNFFVTYATVDHWDRGDTGGTGLILDDWILSRLTTTVEKVSVSLDNFDIFSSTGAIESLVNDLSLWYVRRSRDRVGPGSQSEQDKKACYETLYQVLVTLCKLLAPFTPFLADEMYQNLTGEESVHLSNWPDINKPQINIALETEMQQGIKLASIIHAFRKQNAVKVRIPFRLLKYSGPQELTPAIKKIVMEEVNVYLLEYTGSGDVYEVLGNASESNQDVPAGKMRELVRKIQILRKEKGLRIDEKIRVQLPVEYEKLPANLLADVMSKTLVESYTWGEELTLLIGS
ncbi:MAG: class I tRNA ligase family protein, partial [Patescibacteria group bacterium]